MSTDYTSTSEKTPKTTVQVLDSLFKRYAILACIAATFAIIWSVVRTDLQPELRLFGDSYAFGLGIVLALFYQGDWIAIRSRAKIDMVAVKRMVDELMMRRRVASGFYRGCVYVIQDIDVTYYYKIGKTTSPADRIGHFDTMLPFQTCVVHIISARDCNAVEAVLHRHFASKRKRGEWFALNDADIAWIRQMDRV